MYQAPMQDNNRLQQHNPHHPANVANKVALARVMHTIPGARFGMAAELNKSHGSFRHNPILGPKWNPITALAVEAGKSFNPATKAGLINIASMFAGGPKDFGAGEGPMFNARFEPYQPLKAHGGGDLRGNDMFNVPNTRVQGKGAGIRGLVRRAQGVGRYGGSKMGPEDILRLIEQGREAQVNRNQWLDENKAQFNDRGNARMRENTMKNVLRQGGGNPTNYLPQHQGIEQTVGNHDIQPHDYTDRLKAVRAYDNPQVQEAFGGSPDPIKQALYDMLFGGKGLLRRPQRPGPNSPYGSPYGGGPFG